MSAPETSSVRSRVAFFEQFKQPPAGSGGDDALSCGKRAREAEAITSPGKVREVKEKLLSPSAQDKPPAASGAQRAAEISPGKVRQSVETIIGLTRLVLPILCLRQHACVGRKHDAQGSMSKTALLDGHDQLPAPPFSACCLNFRCDRGQARRREHSSVQEAARERSRARHARSRRRELNSARE